MKGIFRKTVACRKALTALWTMMSLSLAAVLPALAADQKASSAGWAHTVEAARREGQVTIYGSVSPMLILEAGVFQKRYPEIKVVTVAMGRSSNAVERLMAERRANKYLADVIISGSSSPTMLHRAGALSPIKPVLVLPEVVDQSKWWNGKHSYTDEGQKYVFMYMGHPQTGGIYYNTKLVDPKEITSFWDFLNPRWKGKIEARDVSSPGAGSSNMKFFYYNPEIGPKFITRLFSEMDITLFRDRRQSVDWLVTGKYSICFFCLPSEIGRARVQGLPVGTFGLLKEGAGLTTHSGTLGLIDKAPHPNAAKVFINWLLSREGQTTFQRAYVNANVGASNSLRIDIPKDYVPPEERLQDGVNYVEVEIPGRMSTAPMIKLFKEAVAMKQRKPR